MIRNTLLALTLSAGSALTFAAGDHGGGHDVHANDSSSSSSTAASPGRPGDPAMASRTIEVVMHDTMRFSPDEIQVKAGETVKFVVRNAGKMPHEMVLGSAAALKAHAAEMRETPSMKHVDPNMVTVDAGRQGELVWQFDTAGTVDFACLIPGHMEAGMVGKVKVS